MRGETTRRRVLYIEDDLGSRLLVRQVLEEAGHVVVEATNGLGGIEAALREHPSLILLDISLPDVDGYAVAGILGTFPTLAPTPVVALTDDAFGPAGRARTLVAGCDGYIDKPIDVERFADQVAEFLLSTRKVRTPTDLGKLNEQFVSGLLGQLDDVKKTKERLERIDAAMDELTAELGVKALLDTVLPRLAAAIGAIALVAELTQPSPDRVVGRAPQAALAVHVELPPAAEWKHPLALAGRSLGFLSALYSAEASPSEDDEALLRVVAHQVGLAVENARLYEREQSMRREIEAQDRRKDDFLAVLAHELRAPLAPILSSMEVIAHAAGDAGLVQKAREVVERQVRYQAGLLDDLLDLTRIARDKIELVRHVVDLRSVTAAAVEVSRPSIDERRQTLAISAPDDRLLVSADPVRLEQVVINLLTNAAKYTPSGGAISVALDRRAETVMITVRDSGEGIPPEMLDRVFDPFVQVSEAGARLRPGGLGIGLALAKRLVELHGGTIEARSAGRGQGSEFIVRLSVVSASEAAGVEAPPESGAAEAGPAHVLVVEDDRDTREMLRLTLEVAGHRVAVAGTGREAIERAVEMHPEVMLVDLGLPDVDGHEVARQVRAVFGDAIFLVALTGYGRAEDVRQAEAAGFDAHVLKPANVENLASVLVRRRRGARLL